VTEASSVAVTTKSIRLLPASPEFGAAITLTANNKLPAASNISLMRNTTYPLNPIRALDNSLTISQRAGRDVYMNDRTTGCVFTCNTCHLLDVSQNAFSTDGKISIEGGQISQEFKVPHLRNMYETVDKFFKGDVFNFGFDAETSSRKRGQLVDFVMAMDSNFALIVGQQIILSAATGAATDAPIDLLMACAEVAPRSECDLIAKGVIEEQARGFLFDGADILQSDRQSESYSYQQLRDLAKSPDGALTFTCVPPGSGTWMGIDRNRDGVRDSD
jgi:hypothetical protein